MRYGLFDFAENTQANLIIAGVLFGRFVSPINWFNYIPRFKNDINKLMDYIGTGMIGRMKQREKKMGIDAWYIRLEGSLSVNKTNRIVIDAAKIYNERKKKRRLSELERFGEL